MGNIDHITGKTFDTHYAALLVVGKRYARTFDGKARKVVSVSDVKADGKVRIVFDDTTPGKCAAVPAATRFFIR